MLPPRMIEVTLERHYGSCVLSPTKATLLTVGLFVALALAFGAGLLVGLFLHSGGGG